MRIYSMTATFGKLEHEVLTLKPGLNVICAPNEWGKSTWCAFLLAMLYGVDTRSVSTKKTLAEKERYAPWSGARMEGRIDLCWNGRDITIERSTKGKVPLGVFRAYETKTGAEVPELNAANCGQQLLGVEQSVFRRAGFVRLTDLPVTQDTALRHRLNALVTTGDESDDAVRLAESLRELKNKCRYNRTGLLPQALARKEELESKLREWEELDAQSLRMEQRLRENETRIRDLENHRKALEYQASQADQAKVEEAKLARDQELLRMEELQKACAELPPRETVADKCRLLRELSQQWSNLQNTMQEQGSEPEKPKAPAPFRDLTPGEALRQAEDDASLYRKRTGGEWLVMLILSVLCLIGAGVLIWADMIPLAAAAIGIGMLSVACSVIWWIRKSRAQKSLSDKYGTAECDRWRNMALTYGAAVRTYDRDLAKYRSDREEMEKRREELRRQMNALCDNQAPAAKMEQWRQILSKWDGFFTAQSNAIAAEKHLETLQSMARHSSAPAYRDLLQGTREETEAAMRDCRQEQKVLQARREQYRSRMEVLGSGREIRMQLTQTGERIARLEDIYAALNIAQETLTDASVELQRRFAPRISGRAQELLTELTSGRYDRLVLSEDFSLRAGAAEEDVLHDALWRSDGTVDQLYLALRLAVSEELTPEAPLILDDVLVRFDDARAEAALSILASMAEEKQIILFTCQQREKRMLGE